MVDIKNDEIADLRLQLNGYIENNSILLDEKRNLEKSVQELRDAKQQNKHSIDKLADENTEITRICQNQDNSIKSLHSDILKLNSKLEDTNYDLANSKSALRSTQENLVYTQKQVEEGNKNINKLQVITSFTLI